MADENVESINSIVSEINRFPVVFETSGDGRGATDGRRPGQGDGRTVESTIQDVLGWRVRDNDPRGFLAALNRAFSFVEVEGHREWRYQAQSLTVQADLGAVTGAQASIYARTRAMVDQTLPILDRLRPLDPAADPELMEASRAIVRTRLEQLPIELGLDGGPRVARVDQIFEVLTELNLSKLPTETVPAGELQRLGLTFGFDRSRVNTVEEEEAITDFEVLTAYVNSLAVSWAHVRRTFFRDQESGTRFLGTQLVLLSRALATVAETVEEARRALRSVSIGDAEMELIVIHLNSGRAPLSLAEGLRWIEDVATTEGPQLLRDAGKKGVAALRPSIAVLREFAKEAQKHESVGLRHGRVKLAFADLQSNLELATRSTKGITPLVRSEGTGVKAAQADLARGETTDPNPGPTLADPLPPPQSPGRAASRRTPTGGGAQNQPLSPTAGTSPEPAPRPDNT